VAGRRTRDRKVGSSTPGPGAIKSTRSNSAFHPSGVGKSSTGLRGYRVRRGAFTCVGWQVTLCDPIWQVTSRRSEVG